MKAKHVFLTLGLSLAMGLGAVAAFSGVKEVKQAKAVASNVTNGNKRINVIMPSSEKQWIFGDSAKINCSGVSGSISAFDFAVDSDIGTAGDHEAAGVRQMDYEIDGENKYFATKSLGADFETTWWNITIRRHVGSDFYNSKECENGKVWIENCNTYYYDGDSISVWGYYYKAALHTGLDLSAVSYNLYYRETIPEAPAVSGYTFEGWYTDPDLAAGHKWTGGDQKTDINLYAKYVEDEHNYSVTIGSETYALETAPAGGHDAQYKYEVPSATRGQSISFKVDGTTPLAATGDGDASNNVHVPTNKVLTTFSEKKDIYLKKDGSNWSYWLDGRNSVPYFAIIGSDSEIVSLAKNGDKEEYYVTGKHLVKDQTIKLYGSAVNYDGVVESGSVGVSNHGDVMTVDETGDYDFYYKPNEGNKVYFVQLHTYTVDIKGADDPVAMNYVDPGEGYKAQYKAELTVAAGDELKFARDGDALSVSEDSTNHHNVFTPTHKIIKGGSVEVYLKLDNSDNWSYYVSGRDATYYAYVNNALTPLTPNPKNENEVYCVGLHLEAGYTVQVYETSVKNPTKNDAIDKDLISVVDGVLTVKSGINDNYNLYYNFNDGANGSMYIGKMSEADAVADGFAQLFLQTLSTGEGAVCKEDGKTDFEALQTAWASLATEFGKIGKDADVREEAQGILHDANPELDSNIGKFAKLYDYIYHTKYNGTVGSDFAKRFTSSPDPTAKTNANNNNSIVLITVVSISALVASAGLVLLVLKKRKYSK